MLPHSHTEWSVPGPWFKWFSVVLSVSIFLFRLSAFSLPLGFIDPLWLSIWYSLLILPILTYFVVHLTCLPFWSDYQPFACCISFLFYHLMLHIVPGYYWIIPDYYWLLLFIIDYHWYNSLSCHNYSYLYIHNIYIYHSYNSIIYLCVGLLIFLSVSHRFCCLAQLTGE